MRTNFLQLSKQDIELLHKFLDELHFYQQKNHKERYEHSYQQWRKGSERQYMKAHLGCTYIMKLLMWYHHIYKPGSKEHRAKILIEGAIKAAEYLYEEQ